jgi:hypothetical protein
VYKAKWLERYPFGSAAHAYDYFFLEVVMNRKFYGVAALALGLIAAPAAHADTSCTKNFADAAAAGKNMTAASLLLEKAGNCCSTGIDSTAAQSLVSSIKTLVANAATASTSTTAPANPEQVGQVLSAALGCAGQAAIVAIDPELYSNVLADASNFAELARDENLGDGGANDSVQFARRTGALPNNNQQPTVSIEQK